MGEAKRRKKLDPNYGILSKKVSASDLDDLAIIDENEAKFTSTLGVIRFSLLRPPHPDLSRKLKMPLDCNYSPFVLYPKRHDVIIEGVFFTKKGFSQAIILGKKDTTQKVAIEEINNKRNLSQLRNEMLLATKLVYQKRKDETKG